MARILVLGAGVMGSASTVPASDKGHAVALIGTPLDCEIIAALKAGGGHPRLRAPLAGSVEFLDFDEVSAGHFDRADLVIVGVSSAGVLGRCGLSTTDVIRLIAKRISRVRQRASAP